MASFLRTHTCGALRETDLGTRVALSGWVHRLRDLGGLIFIDLRDRFGITQIVLDPKKNPDIYAIGQGMRSEFVIAVRGQVSVRQDKNLRIPTGAIEIFADSLEVLSKA